MARSLIASITKPVSSLVSPLLRPAIRFAKHPLAPLGMGVAGAVVENIAEQTGVTKLLTKLGVQGVDYLKSGAEFGLSSVAGLIDIDGEDEPKSKKGETKKEEHEHTHVAGTPNAYEVTTGLHVGCAGDTKCGPCAKKERLAKVAAAVENMSEKEFEAFEVGLARKPLLPRTHSDVATQAIATSSSAQAQIDALKTQLQAAQDAVTAQKLTDQIAALQAQVVQANALVTQAQSGGSLAALLEQLKQLKALENIISPPVATPPTAQMQVDMYGYPMTAPWGSFQDQDGGVLQDPNGTVYGNPDIDPQFVSDPLLSQYGSATGDPTTDYWSNYAVEGVSEPSILDGVAYPAPPGEDGECEPCKVTW